MQTHIILWVPVTHYGVPELLCEELACEELKDVPNLPSVYLKASINKANYDICFSYSIDSCASFRYLSLTCENASYIEDGFIHYSMDIPDDADDFVLKGLKEHFHTSYYHYLKRFFHEHYHHNDDEDSMLSPFWYAAKVSISSQLNDIVNQIAARYIEKLSGYSKQIMIALNSKLDVIRQKKDISVSIEFLQDYLCDVYRVKGELRYCKYVLHLCQKHECIDSYANLSSAIDEFLDSLDSLKFWTEHYTSIVSYSDGKRGITWGIIGAILGLSSLIVSIVFAILNS